MRAARAIPYGGPMNETKRLERSTEDKWLGGVCGGLARYFDIDATIVRLIFIVAFFGFGTGLLVYLVLWFVMPRSAQF
jgi:phage shock protein C